MATIQIDATGLDCRRDGIWKAVKGYFGFQETGRNREGDVREFVYRVAQASDNVQDTLERVLEQAAPTHGVVRYVLKNDDFLAWCNKDDARCAELRGDLLLTGLYCAYTVAVALNEGLDLVHSEIARLEEKIMELEDRGTDRAAEKAEKLTELKEELEDIASTMENNQADGAMAMLEALEDGDLEGVLRVLGDGALQLDIGCE